MFPRNIFRTEIVGVEIARRKEFSLRSERVISEVEKLQTFKIVSHK